MAELIINDAIMAGRKVGNEEDEYKRNMVLSTYNPFETPANIEVAKKHGAAKRVYLCKEHDHGHEEEEEDNTERCVCCGLPVTGDPIPVTANLDSLYHLGSGFALYFRFIKYALGMLLLVLLTSGIYNLATNSHSGDCTDPDAVVEDEDGIYCTKGYILTYALPNKRAETDLLTAQAALNLAVVVIIMLFFHYLRYRFRKTEIEADDKTTTPGDYTIVIEGIDRETTNKEIVEWVKQFSTESQPLTIERIIRPFDVNEYLALTTERNEIILHEMHHEEVNEKVGKSEEKKMEDHMKAIDQKLQDLKKPGVIKKCPVAYVIFSTAQQADVVKSKFEKTFVQKMFGACFSKSTGFDKIRGVKVEVERAPEPTDINWLNQKYTDKDRKVKRFITNLSTFVLILMSFGIIILCNWGQNKAIKAYGKGSPTVQGLSIVASIVIVITNTILTITIDILTRLERHGTNTKFLRGVTQKLAVAQFVNTALTSIFAELILAEPKHEEDTGIRAMNFYGKGGLLENIFWVFVTNAFLGPILTIIDPAYYLKLFKQKQLIKQGDKNKMTQKEANLLFEGTPLNMPAKFAAMIKIILMTTFYAPALPIALVFTIAGLFLSFWADKYALLRRNALPHSLDDDLTDAMVELLEWAACTFAIGNLMYVFTLENIDEDLAFSDTAKILAWVTLGLSLFHTVFPMEALNAKLFPIKDEVTEVETYQHCRAEFNTDYDRENPNTRSVALSTFIKKINKLPSLATTGNNTFFNVVKQKEKQEHGPAGHWHEIPEPVVDFKSLDHYANRMGDSTTKTPSPVKPKTIELEEITPKVEENRHKDAHRDDEMKVKRDSVTQSQPQSLSQQPDQKEVKPLNPHEAHNDRHTERFALVPNDDESANLNTLEYEPNEDLDRNAREIAVNRSPVRHR